MVLVSPSILASDFSKLGEEIMAIDKAGADWIHLDVMDGNFVPNLTFGAPIIKKCRRHTKKPFDAHLMIEKPERYIDDFIEAGVDSLTLHDESTTKDKIFESFQKLKEKGIKCGITINPETSVEDIAEFLEEVDLILIMSVKPGFGGQKFMPESLEKIQFLKQKKEQDSKKYSYLIQVDGGINSETVKSVIDAGVDCIVAGSFVFKAEDYEKPIQFLKSA